jgi:adenylosuccinate lyase
MGRVWSEENKFQKWLDVELAAAETLAEAGIVPREAAAKLRERARVDVARINEIEAKVKHDVIAFTIAVQEAVGDPEAARWLHYGLTSNDVVDTAQALLIRQASHLIEKDLEAFGEVLERRAWEFKDTPEIGRTHGIHAEPITFGLKVANWYAENRRDLARFQVAAHQLAVGKISGAVGTCTHLGPEIEQKICQRLGLATAPITSQVIERDRHAQLWLRRSNEWLWKFAICSARKSAKLRNHLAASSAAVQPCRINAIRFRANRFAGSRAWCVRIPWQPSRTLPSGTSGTFRTVRWSA